MCSYCGCQSIGAIGRFMAEHEDLINQTTVLRESVASGDPERIRDSMDHLVAHLHPHTRAEEQGLFAVLKRNPDFVNPVDSLCAEHTRLDDLADRIRGGESDLVDTFVFELREHIHREDNGLFPAAAIELDGPDWEEIDELTPPPDQHARAQ